MEVVGHHNKADQSRVTLLPDRLQLLYEDGTVSVSPEYRFALVYIAGNVVKYTRKVLVRPFLCHMGEVAAVV
jgi:hypothetical protein